MENNQRGNATAASQEHACIDKICSVILNNKHKSDQELLENGLTRDGDKIIMKIMSIKLCTKENH